MEINKEVISFDATTCTEAARNQLERLKFLHENGCEWDERTYSEAIR